MTMTPTDQGPQECVHFCHCIDRVAIAEEVANNIEWHCELQNDCPDYQPKQEKDNERVTELKPEYVDFIPPVSDMKEGVLYISRVYLTTAHLCACGCGNVVVLPYGRRDGMFWTLTERLSGVTIRPSVGSFNLPCKSHYYITDNKIEWL